MTDKTKNCEVCGNEFTPWPGRPGLYCSRQCANVGVSRRTAEKRGDTLRGRGEGKSYPKIHGRHAHRVMAEQALGRPLLPGEIVHHLDDNKLNYDPGNLKVMQTQGEHAALHHTKNRKCELDGCERKHYAYGTCKYHYDQRRRAS